MPPHPTTRILGEPFMAGKLYDKPYDKPSKYGKPLPPARALIETTQAYADPGRELIELRDMVLKYSSTREPDGRQRKLRIRFDGRHWRDGRLPHPNSLAALEVHRWGTIFGGPNAVEIPRCERTLRSGRPCQQPAIRNGKICRIHGGAAILERRRRNTYADYRPDRTRLSMNVIRTLVKSGQFPMSLIRDNPDFREVFRRARFGISYREEQFAHWTYAQRRLHHEACATLVLDWIAAWEGIAQRGDFRSWTDCVRRCMTLGISGQI
jgi:hypothetical protein